ncbi:MAG: mechanosensitive ion channel [Desulfoprunum sp.]|nr:mechanosensitive ion channel [Desulfoprunum sp.]
MKREIPACCFLLVLLLWGISSFAATSQETQAGDENYDPLKGRQVIKKLVSSLADKKRDSDELESLKKDIANHLLQGKNGQLAIQYQIKEIDDSLKLLGEKVEGESEKIVRERNGIEAKRKAKDAELAEYRLLTLAATDALKDLETLQKAGYRQRLFVQGLPFWSLHIDTNANLWEGLNETAFPARLSVHQIALSLLIVLCAIWFCIRMPARMQHLVKPADNSTLGFLITRIHYQSLAKRMFLGFLIGGTIASWLLRQADSPSTFSWIFLALLIACFLPLLVEALWHLAGIDETGREQTNLLRWRWQLRVAAVGIAILLFIIKCSESAFLPEFILYIGRAIAVLCCCLLIFVSVQAAIQCSRLRSSWRFVRPVLLIVGGGVVYLEISGFRALSLYVMTSLALSFLLYASTVLIFDVLQWLYAHLIQEKGWLARKIGISRQRDEEALEKSIGWLQDMARIILLLFAALLLLRIWDPSALYAGILFTFLFEGFHVGNLLIIPSRIVLGILVFIVGWSATFWLKKLLEQKWTPNPAFAASTREAMLTVIGYACYVVTALMAFSLAGVSFTNLAVIAGALSVGIGFGLQNIVNNFVSGLILLFERPIKRGDWVVVGSTEGYVKKISVRSTIIQTFDRSDVIVPNSELIASPVTNMMFNDSRGRLSVSVGVAYGSDTELVRQLLLEIAGGNGEVIVDGSSPNPEVFFEAFGDSSLNFELLCHLKNVDNKRRVRSEINFKIDEAFRQHDVEIPFPQRDIHIKRSV